MLTKYSEMSDIELAMAAYEVLKSWDNKDEEAYFRAERQDLEEKYFPALFGKKKEAGPLAEEDAQHG